MVIILRNFFPNLNKTELIFRFRLLLKLSKTKLTLKDTKLNRNDVDVCVYFFFLVVVFFNEFFLQRAKPISMLDMHLSIKIKTNTIHQNID